MLNTEMKKVIWIIDDDTSVLEVLKVLLEEQGYRIEVLNDASTLPFHAMEKDKPSLIFVDLLMRGVDGRDVIKQIREHKPTSDTKLVLMTADIHPEEKAREAGADGYLKKPFTIEELSFVVAKFVQK